MNTELDVSEFHVFVTSNASKTHIIFGKSNRTACGMENEAFEKVGPRFPNSEIRSTYSKSEFIAWFQSQAKYVGPLAFCERCKNKFIQWHQALKKKEEEQKDALNNKS